MFCQMSSSAAASAHAHALTINGKPCTDVEYALTNQFGSATSVFNALSETSSSFPVTSSNMRTFIQIEPHLRPAALFLCRLLDATATGGYAFCLQYSVRGWHLYMSSQGFSPLTKTTLSETDVNKLLALFDGRVQTDLACANDVLKVLHLSASSTVADLRAASRIDIECTSKEQEKIVSSFPTARGILSSVCIGVMAGIFLNVLLRP